MSISKLQIEWYEQRGGKSIDRRQFIAFAAGTAGAGALAYFAGCQSGSLWCESTFTYCNPIIERYLADPCIIKDEGLYYLFATGKAPDERFIQIYKSDNLTDWTFVRGAVTKGKPGAWNRRNFWAPEVVKLDGEYHLYYTASLEDTPKNTGNRVGLAVADSPEGPFILKRDKTYFLTYSTGAWTNETYNIRYAVGESPTGPFIEQTNKILESNEFVKGPGHHSFFTGPDGKILIV